MPRVPKAAGAATPPPSFPCVCCPEQSADQAGDDPGADVRVSDRRSQAIQVTGALSHLWELRSPPEEVFKKEKSLLFILLSGFLQPSDMKTFSLTLGYFYYYSSALFMRRSQVISSSVMKVLSLSCLLIPGFLQARPQAGRLP